MSAKHEVKLSAVDAEVAIRLHEEIQGLSHEVALIIGRTLGAGSRPVAFSYGPAAAHPHPAPAGITADDGLVQLIDCYKYDDGTCGCMDYIKLVCYEC